MKTSRSDAITSLVHQGHTETARVKKHVGNGRMIEANPHLRSWRETVAVAAHLEMAARGLKPFEGALKIELMFELPKGTSVTRRTPHVKPDLDKLCRSIFDGLEKAGVYQNDSQIVDLHAIKVYGVPRSGVTIHLDYL